MVPRETENNAYAKFWGDKKHYGMLWYFLEWSIVLGGLHAMVTRGEGIPPYMANTGICRWTEHCQRTESRRTILHTNEPLLKGI